jgi:hypothetical protein
LIRFQADADIHHGIVVAVRRREPAIDFASDADSELVGVPDPDVLEIAASQGRILITHDRRTMLYHFRNLLEEGKSSPGLFLVSQFAPLGPVVEALDPNRSPVTPEDLTTKTPALWQQAHTYRVVENRKVVDMLSVRHGGQREFAVM